MKNLLLAVLVLITGCCTGSHQAKGTAQPVVAWDKVNVYYSMPPNAKFIGTIYAHSFSDGTLPPTTGDALGTLKKEAAKLGANGVVVNPTDENFLNSAELDGKAIFVAP
jgi:hypothetical protein